MSCTIEWSVATTPPELGDGWHHSLKFHSRACQKLQHKYESPNGQTFRSLRTAMKSLEDMPIVPKSSIKKAKSSIKKAKSSSSVKASVDPVSLSEYEIQNQKNIARNQAFLRELGLVDDALGLAKKAPRASPHTATKVGQLGTRSSERPKALPDRLDLYDLST